MTTHLNAPRVASLYAGCGGLDSGFASEGYRLVWANERNTDALASRVSVLERTGYAAHDETTVPGDFDLADLPRKGDVDVVIGGPPCQGFSVAGKQNPHDPRSQQVHMFLDAVQHLRPLAFVMENVAALGYGARWADIRIELIHRARSMGYTTTLGVLNACDYGVAQDRRRMFLVGATAGNIVLPGRSSSRITVREALQRLPTYGEPGNNTRCAAAVVPARKPVLRPSPWAGMMFNGAGRPINPDSVVGTLPASMGGNGTPILDQDNLDDPTLPLWILGYHAHLRSGGSPVRDSPSRLRRLTVEEAALLQGFPVGVRWSGSRSTVFRQIGNAVPPPMARAVAHSLRPLMR